MTEDLGGYTLQIEDFSEVLSRSPSSEVIRNLIWAFFRENEENGTARRKRQEKHDSKNNF